MGLSPVKSKYQSQGKSCSGSICRASAAKREFDFPVMILFHRSDGETSAFLEHEQENEHESAGEVQIRKLG